MPVSTGARTGLSPLFLATSALIWASAVIVMGILAYWFSINNHQPSFLVYSLVISVLTVAFFIGAFFLVAFLAYLLVFNLIFSYLWLVVVVYTASTYSHESAGALAHTVEAFSFIAFFLLLFNVLFSWHIGFPAEHRTSASRV